MLINGRLYDGADLVKKIFMILKGCGGGRTASSEVKIGVGSL